MLYNNEFDDEEEAKMQCKEKLAIIGGVDPFVSVVGELCESMESMDSWVKDVCSPKFAGKMCFHWTAKSCHRFS